MKISIAWMASTLRELELLSSLLALLSTLPASRPLHRAAALEIFHLVTGLFLTIYASHIPCDFHCVSHSTPTSFLFDFLFHFYQSLWRSTLQHPQPVQVYKNRNNFNFTASSAPVWFFGVANPIFSFFHNLVSIHFQFCFKYISPRFTMLGLPMLSLSMGSNFRTFHPRQSQQRLILCTR